MRRKKFFFAVILTLVLTSTQSYSKQMLTLDPATEAKIDALISKMTLEEGDLVFTGTPAGVGKVVPGDIIYTELSNLVSLKVEVSK